MLKSEYIERGFGLILHESEFHEMLHTIIIELNLEPSIFSSSLKDFEENSVCGTEFVFNDNQITCQCFAERFGKYKNFKLVPLNKKNANANLFGLSEDYADAVLIHLPKLTDEERKNSTCLPLSFVYKYKNIIGKYLPKDMYIFNRIGKFEVKYNQDLQISK